MAADLPDELFTEIQGAFRKAPVLLVGSGFSCGYGLPGMWTLAEHLANTVDDVLTTGEAKNAWAQAIDAIKDNLETGLNNIPLGAAGWAEIVSAIRSETARLILEKTATAESKVLQEKVDTGHAPSRLLNRLFDGSPRMRKAFTLSRPTTTRCWSCFAIWRGYHLIPVFPDFVVANHAPGQYSRINTTESGWLKSVSSNSITGFAKPFASTSLTGPLVG